MYVYIYVCVPMGKPLLRTSEHYVGILKYLTIFSTKLHLFHQNIGMLYIQIYTSMHLYACMYIHIGVYTYIQVPMGKPLLRTSEHYVRISLPVTIFHKSAFVPPKYSIVKRNRMTPAISSPNLLRNMHIIYPA